MVVAVNRLAKDKNDQIYGAGARAYVWSLRPSAKAVAVDLSRWTKSWPSAALSPDGHLLYTATPTVRARDLRSGRVRTLFVHGATKAWEAFEISPMDHA